MSELLEHELCRRANYVYNAADTYGLLRNENIPAVWIDEFVAVIHRYDMTTLWEGPVLIFRANVKDDRYEIRDLDACLKSLRLFRQMMILDDLANV